MNRLLDIGFQPVGSWNLDNGNLNFDLTGHWDTKNIIYAFISISEILYIGKTTRRLSDRLSDYKTIYESSGITNKNNHKNIKEKLEKTTPEPIQIFVFVDNGLFHYGDYHLNLAAGLEDSIISKISPPWNGSNKTNKKTNTELQEEKSKINRLESDPQNNRFNFTLSTTYFNQGFFNVEIKKTGFFGNDGDPISIYLGEKQDLLEGYINRSANQNNTPRIMGGSKLRNWFQNNFTENSLVSVEILSTTSILLNIAE